MRFALSFLIVVSSTLFAPAITAAANPDKPNILWIISEDMGPWLGCYGEKNVQTPHIDALAAKGIRYTQVWSGGAACSPSRSSLFSGMYAIALGTETHREPRPVPTWAFFPQYLREAGYYCTNNAKTDYNARPMGANWWDASSRQANYLKRSAGQPFFHCYSSLMETHMSCIINHPLDRRTERTIDPSVVTLPAWLPNEPALRDDRAWHLDWIGRMDRRVGEILAELERSGEAANTIVFFFSDHGGCLPGGKGFAWDYGFRVPLITYYPPKFAHLAPKGTAPGGTCDELVSFLDFAPTMFSLTGTPSPKYLQGQAFAGPARAAQPRETALAFRGINGGRWDPVRAIRNDRYLYIRNFLPHRPAGQRQDYQWAMPGQQAWELAFLAGRCDPLQSRFWLPREPEELYDLVADPEQTRNLAREESHRATVEKLRTELRTQLAAVGDIAYTPNSLRAPGGAATYFDRMRSQPQTIASIAQAAWIASAPQLTRASDVAPLLASADPVIRYWGATALTRLAYAAQDRAAILAAARPLLTDDEPQVRVAAGEALVALDEADAGMPVLLTEIRTTSGAAREALAAIETLGPRRAAAAGPVLAELNTKKTTFFLRSALITLGRLTYAQLIRPGTPSEE
jgi:arylsulfatase A-like enzyme